MAKKPRTKDRLGSFKRMLKNQQIFYRTLIKHPKLNQELNDLAMMPAMTEIREKFPFVNKKISLPLCFDNYAGMMNVGLKLAASLDEENQGKIIAFIDRFISETEFGDEWIGPLLTFITSGILCPPIQNFHLRRSGKRIQLTLNPDTSIDDLRNEWPAIDMAIAGAWPNFKKTNLTSKFNEELQELINTLKAKKNVSDDFKYEELTTYETMLAKQSQNPKKAVADYRGKLLVTQGIPRKTVRIKSKKTDRDVVKELYSPKTKKAEAKKVNTLRQRFHRLKS